VGSVAGTEYQSLTDEAETNTGKTILPQVPEDNGNNLFAAVRNPNAHLTSGTCSAPKAPGAAAFLRITATRVPYAGCVAIGARGDKLNSYAVETDS
jgi:hypothetical protein